MSKSPRSRSDVLGETIFNMGRISIFVFVSAGFLHSFYTAQSGPISFKNSSIFALGLTVAVFIVGTVVGIVLDENRRSEQAAKDRESAALRAKELARREARDQEAQRTTLTQAIIANSKSAVTEMAGLPTHLKNAESWAQAAVVHYKDGAFSPFWSDIEQAYACLAVYRGAADTIAEAAHRHAGLVESLIAADGDPEPYRTFPVTLDTQQVTRTLQDSLKELEAMVYEAQKQPVFAQIWEQRRTTSAVVTGFANLELAVRNMGGAISMSMASMAQAISTSNDRVELAVRDMSTDVSSRLVSASNEQTLAMHQLTKEVNKAKQEIYYQTWGHYSLLD